jgi:hypothetical protein
VSIRLTDDATAFLHRRLVDLSLKGEPHADLPFRQWGATLRVASEPLATPV